MPLAGKELIWSSSLDVKMIIELRHDISNNVVCVTSKASGQPGHTRSLIGAFASHFNIV